MRQGWAIDPSASRSDRGCHSLFLLRSSVFLLIESWQTSGKISLTSVLYRLPLPLPLPLPTAHCPLLLATARRVSASQASALPALSLVGHGHESIAAPVRMTLSRLPPAPGSAPYLL